METQKDYIVPMDGIGLIETYKQLNALQSEIGEVLVSNSDTTLEELWEQVSHIMDNLSNSVLDQAVQMELALCHVDPEDETSCVVTKTPCLY